MKELLISITKLVRKLKNNYFYFARIVFISVFFFESAKEAVI